MRMKKHPQFFTSKSPCRSSRVGITIGIDLGDIWSHYGTKNEDGEVIDRGRFRTNAAGVGLVRLNPCRCRAEVWTNVSRVMRRC
jgi:hypothetical protein